MEAINLSKTLRPYENKWVAITKDYKKVIASGKTLKEAIKNAAGKNVPPIYTYVNFFKTGYSPTNT